MSADRQPVLEVEGLDVTFQRRRGPLTKPVAVRAVRDASFTVHAGETVGLVGESGSGKTTSARAILGLVPASAGRIRAGGFEPTAFAGTVPPAYRRAVQAVFQDPFGSLNPSMTIDEIVGEPLDLHFGLGKAERRSRVAELLASVGLAAHHAQRYPYELSGGQRQRVAIARAISVEPQLVVLDEPVSALDVSVQSQVVNLLEDLQERTGVAYLFVAHDLAVVRHASDRIVVMYHSRIVEEGPADRVCDEPQHPYTEALLAAVPVPDPTRQAERRRLRQSLSVVTNERPSADGCPFAPRCPLRMDVCDEVFPAWEPAAGGGGLACHARGSSAQTTT